ncbi:MAG TPA: hypothetical protein PLA50_17345, partial [Bacteroidia bacterium]|nr:hypothetical protein [Bacteroidia bacterium]
ETVREKVPPSTPEIALRRAQIAAKASPETALEWIGKIDPAGSDWKTVRLPLARLHAALLEQTKNRKAGIDLVCGLVDSAVTPQEARQALLLLEVFLDGRIPADLEPRLAAWSQDDQSPAHEAAALHRILLFKPAADQPAALREFAASATDPELKAEATLRLGEAPSATPTASDLAERTRFETARRAFREKRFDEAMRQSIQNAEASDGEETVRDLFNAAVSALLANDSEAFKRLEAEVATLSPQSTALVDLDYLGSLYFAAKGEPSAFERLNSFVLEHPKHPANIDARLALAEINLNQAPPRPNAARGILEGLATRPLTLVQNERLDYLTVWIEVTDQNSTELVKQADAFAANWPNSEYLPEILMLLASEHFKRRNLPAAAAIFDRIATTFPDSPLADTARFFEAKSSPATPGTIDKWRAIADGDSPLAAEAAHEMGLLLISLDQFEEARQTLTALLERLPSDSPLRFATIADLGYASYLEALDNGKDRAKLEEAANRFAELSSPTSVPAKWRYNAAVRRGRCLEAMGKASVALEIYRSIVDETATSSPGAEETEWIFRAGFAAIDILNGQDDRGTAIAVADALSGQSGPRAIDAARLAERLRLKHWIWD